MKPQYLLPLMISALISLSTLQAGNIDKATALKVAKNFYQSGHPQASFNLDEVRVFKVGRLPVSYLFVLQNRDYVIVSAEDAAKPILGYGEKASPDNAMPVNLEDWIETVNQQINALREKDITATPAIKKEWNELISGRWQVKSKNEVLPPLLTSTWHQNGRYSEMCPEFPDNPGNHSLAGCVANAMSQVMYYFRYPSMGDSSKGYHSQIFDTVYANFGQTQYNYTEMVDQIHNKSIPQLATLLFHAGVSVETSYGYGGAGAYTADVADALKSYFRYSDSTQYLERSSMSEEEWMNMLINNITSKRPVIYHGKSGFSGHSFVLDGLDDNGYFHVNWGWEGWWNGYYSIDLLNPSGYEFSNSQGAVFNITPGGNYPPYCDAVTDTLDFFTGTLSDGSGPFDYQGNATGQWLIAPADSSMEQIQVSFSRFKLADASDSVVLYDGPDASYPILAAFSGADEPYAVTSTQNRIFVKFTSGASGSSDGWHLTYLAFKEGFCNGLQTITKETYYLNDKSGPYNYMNNSDCRWLIAPKTQEIDTISKITLNFLEIDLEEGKDFLTVYNGPTTDHPVAFQYTGNPDADTVEIANSQLLLHFTSDEQITKDGFTLTYEVTPYRYCEGTISLTDPTGTFSDGSGTNDYQSDTDCSWYIKPENADTVVLHFTKFDMEPGYDHVSIFDPEPIPDYLIAQYSGHTMPADVKSPSGRMLVKFHTDYVTNFDGFEAEYWSITVGQEENEITRLKAYPNPCSDQFRVTLPEGEEFVRAGIYAASGREIILEPVYKHSQELHFSTSELEQGIYFLHLQSKDQSYYTKIIVQHD